MSLERTLSIIKPDAISKQLIGQVISRFEKAGLRVAGIKMLHLSKHQAEAFYEIHKDRPFFNSLIAFMCSGPVIVQVLEGENAIARNREIMGATNPREAQAGTIRADFADSIDHNVVHGSDSPQTAQQEIEFFFKTNEIFSHVPVSELA